MERMLGRTLEPFERVHHRNGVRDDNRQENLELWVLLGKSKKDPAGQRMIDLVAEFFRSLEIAVTDDDTRTKIEADFRRIFRL